MCRGCPLCDMMPTHNPRGRPVRSRLHWTHSKGQYVTVERNPTYMGEIFAKFLVLGFILAVPARLLQWESLTAVAGASLYPFWELVRVSDALGELATLWNEQYRTRQETERAEYHRKKREQRDKAAGRLQTRRERTIPTVR